MFFSITKSENRRAERVLPGRRVGTTVKEEVVGIGCGRSANTVCTCKWKNDTTTLEKNLEAT
jgi:hypothetical protein